MKTEYQLFKFIEYIILPLLPLWARSLLLIISHWVILHIWYTIKKMLHNISKSANFLVAVIVCLCRQSCRCWCAWIFSLTLWIMLPAVLNVIETFFLKIIHLAKLVEEKLFFTCTFFLLTLPKAASPQRNRLDIAVPFWSEKPSPK